MFNGLFISVLCLLFTIMIFTHFTEYRNNLSRRRWMSAAKINLWLAVSYFWFLNYLYFILRSDDMSLFENFAGAAGSLLFAAVIIFNYYPKMSKACRLFFAKRYTMIMGLGVAGIAFSYGIFILIVLIGLIVVSVEISHLRRRKIV